MTDKPLRSEASQAKPNFKNAVGSRYTKGLFYEETGADKTSVVYTLKNDDYLGYPSLYKLYMAEEDLTEYDFANKYLDGWDHWCMIKDAHWFKEYIERWRTELLLKIQARSLKAVKALAKGQTRDSFAAQKYLLERGWVPKEEKTKAGRPSKEQISSEATRMAQEEHLHNEALKRISIN